jgi:pyruvate dehydrogenase E1 component alpha subunit
VTRDVDKLLLEESSAFGEPYRVLSDDGREIVGSLPDLSDAEVADLLAAMIAARINGARFFSLQRQGRAGTYAPIDGQEAAVAGVAAALEPATDWFLPQYRELVALARYGPAVLERFALYQRGHPEGGHFPEPLRVFPVQISLAAQIPHAVGLAWATKLREEPGVACVFFGDGASSEGDFYEAGNLAGVLRAPVLFCCVNNGWAISTPLSQQTAAETFAAKAAAFGIPGVRVDGNDALAVYALAAAARRRAAAGDGPTLLELVTYRMGPHTTADDPDRYVPAEERSGWEGRDPVRRLRTHLEGRGLWDEARQAAAEAAATEAMDAAWDKAEATPLAPDAFFDHVFAEPTPRMERHRAELRAHLDQRNEE